MCQITPEGWTSGLLIPEIHLYLGDMLFLLLFRDWQYDKWLSHLTCKRKPLARIRWFHHIQGLMAPNIPGVCVWLWRNLGLLCRRDGRALVTFNHVLLSRVIHTQRSFNKFIVFMLDDSIHIIQIEILWQDSQYMWPMNTYRVNSLLKIQFLLSNPYFQPFFDRGTGFRQFIHAYVPHIVTSDYLHRIANIAGDGDSKAPVSQCPSGASNASTIGYVILRLCKSSATEPFIFAYSEE